MRIGILADSHGRIESTRHAVAAMKTRDVDVIVHLGDIETEAVLDELVGHEARIVFGNCDWDVPRLTQYAQTMGITVDHPMGELVDGTKRIRFTHGHLPDLMDQAIADGVEYLLHGHSHETRDERVGGTRVINPGALFRAARYTAGVLDTGSDSLELLDLPKS